MSSQLRLWLTNGSAPRWSYRGAHPTEDPLLEHPSDEPPWEDGLLIGIFLLTLKMVTFPLASSLSRICIGSDSNRMPSFSQTFTVSALPRLCKVQSLYEIPSYQSTHHDSGFLTKPDKYRFSELRHFSLMLKVKFVSPTSEDFKHWQGPQIVYAKKLPFRVGTSVPHRKTKCFI